MSDPITGTPSHKSFAKAATVMKELEPSINRAHLLHQALTIGQVPYGGKGTSPWTGEQEKVLLDKYYNILVEL